MAWCGRPNALVTVRWLLLKRFKPAIPKTDLLFPKLWSAAPDGSWPAVAAGALNHQKGLENLADDALQRGSHDNITVVAGGFELASGESV